MPNFEQAPEKGKGKKSLIDKIVGAMNKVEEHLDDKAAERAMKPINESMAKNSARAEAAAAKLRAAQESGDEEELARVRKEIYDQE